MIPDPSNSPLTVSNLSIGFDRGLVLDGVSMSPPAGQRAVIVGPAASGKSVLLKCMVGLHQPDTGSVEVFGRNLTDARERDRAGITKTIGVSFQQRGLFDSLTVWENIAFKLTHVAGVDTGDARDIALEMLTLVDLSATVADLRPNELSGGMQKRVSLARAIAGDPKILLLDEPTAGLDPITTTRINDIIRRTTEDPSVTTLAITSDMTSAVSVYDHLYMLHGGKIVWSGPTADIESAEDPYLTQLIHGSADGPIRMPVHSQL